MDCWVLSLEFLIQQIWDGIENFVSNKFPNAADAAGLVPYFENHCFKE